MTLEDNYLTDEQVAEFLKVSKATLAKQRCAGRGHPPYVKIGKRVLYPKKEFQKWLDARPIRKAIA